MLGDARARVYDREEDIPEHRPCHQRRDRLDRRRHPGAAAAHGLVLDALVVEVKREPAACVDGGVGAPGRRIRTAGPQPVILDSSHLYRRHMAHGT